MEDLNNEPINSHMPGEFVGTEYLPKLGVSSDTFRRGSLKYGRMERLFYTSTNSSENINTTTNNSDSDPDFDPVTDSNAIEGPSTNTDTFNDSTTSNRNTDANFNTIFNTINDTFFKPITESVEDIEYVESSPIGLTELTPGSIVEPRLDILTDSGPDSSRMSKSLEVLEESEGLKEMKHKFDASFLARLEAIEHLGPKHHCLKDIVLDIMANEVRWPRRSTGFYESFLIRNTIGIEDGNELSSEDYRKLRGEFLSNTEDTVVPAKRNPSIRRPDSPQYSQKYKQQRQYLLKYSDRIPKNCVLPDMWIDFSSKLKKACYTSTEKITTRLKTATKAHDRTSLVMNQPVPFDQYLHYYEIELLDDDCDIAMGYLTSKKFTIDVEKEMGLTPTPVSSTIDYLENESESEGEGEGEETFSVEKILEWRDSVREISENDLSTKVAFTLPSMEFMLEQGLDKKMKVMKQYEPGYYIDPNFDCISENELYDIAPNYFGLLESSTNSDSSSSSVDGSEEVNEVVNEEFSEEFSENEHYSDIDENHSYFQVGRGKLYKKIPAEPIPGLEPYYVPDIKCYWYEKGEIGFRITKRPSNIKAIPLKRFAEYAKLWGQKLRRVGILYNVVESRISFTMNGTLLEDCFNINFTLKPNESVFPCLSVGRCKFKTHFGDPNLVNDGFMFDLNQLWPLFEHHTEDKLLRHLSPAILPNSKTPRDFINNYCAFFGYGSQKKLDLKTSNGSFVRKVHPGQELFSKYGGGRSGAPDPNDPFSSGITQASPIKVKYYKNRAEIRKFYLQSRYQEAAHAWNAIRDCGCSDENVACYIQFLKLESCLFSIETHPEARTIIDELREAKLASWQTAVLDVCDYLVKAHIKLPPHSSGLMRSDTKDSMFIEILKELYVDPFYIHI